MNLIKEIEKLSDEKKKDLILHLIGIYTEDWNTLPFVYCPVCGKKVKVLSSEKK